MTKYLILHLTTPVPNPAGQDIVVQPDGSLRLGETITHSDYAFTVDPLSDLEAVLDRYQPEVSEPANVPAETES